MKSLVSYPRSSVFFLAISLAAGLAAQPSFIAVGPAGSGTANVYNVDAKPFKASTLRAIKATELVGIDIQPGTAQLFACGSGTLYRLDRKTGALSTVGAMGFKSVTSIAFAPNGTLYGIAASGTVGGDTLITVDAKTGKSKVVGKLGVSNVSAFSIHPADGAFWCTTTDRRPYMYYINPRTGKATRDNAITDVDGPFVGMTIDNLGRAHMTRGGSSGGQLVRVYLSNGEASNVGRVFKGPVNDLAALRSPNLNGANGCGRTGGAIGDASLPRIGRTWEVYELISTTDACRGNMIMAAGDCHAKGVSIGGASCSACSGCKLHAYPIMMTAQWDIEGLQVKIPNNPALVGVQFCLQSACGAPAPATCMCLSNTLQVTIQR